MPNKRASKNNNNNNDNLDQVNRKQYLSRLKRIEAYVETYDPSVSDSASLKTRLTALQETWRKMEEIPDLTDSDESFREEFEDIYFETTSKMEIFINYENVKNNNTKIDNGNISSSENSINAVQLPKIQLPTFNGDYEHWLSFRDTFLSLIHEKPNLPNIQKFQYLKSCLKGDAAKVIANLQVSSDSYEVSWELLKKRYDNNRIIVTKHVRSIFELNKLEKPTGIALRQLLDNVTTHIRALGSLKQPVEHWDTLIVYLVSSKLDYISLREWENSLASTEFPTWSKMHDFLSHRCQVLESVDTKRLPASQLSDNKSRSVFSKYEKSKKPPTGQQAACFVTQKDTCSLCPDKTHPLYWCNKFKKLSVADRCKEVKRLRLCESCLNSGHETKSCKSDRKCSQCGKSHNSLLHDSYAFNSKQYDRSIANNNASSSSNNEESNISTTLTHIASNSFTPNMILLSTVLLKIHDSCGNVTIARALLDSASQSNFITQALAQHLKLKHRLTECQISGINSSKTQSCSVVQAKILSRISDYSSSLEFLVIPKITQEYPPVKLKVSTFEIPSNIELADPNFYQPSQIDLLLGAEIFYEILGTGQIKLPNNLTFFQKTSFGWVVCGKAQQSSSSRIIQPLCHLSINNSSLSSLEEKVERFWQIENCSDITCNLTAEEKECETHFRETTFREENSGRFVITLPVKGNLSNIGSTREIAHKRLLQLTKKLDNNPIIKKQYVDFIMEYLKLGHMKKATPNPSDASTYYMPHHAVIRQESLTTKLRVVFNASTIGPNGSSLNSLLKVGPNIQDDLFTLITRFRQHQYVLTGDITKMYRMIRLHPDQHDLHRVLWWDEKFENIVEYCLVTLTYGTAPASFIATRCLHQLADDEKDLNIASVILKRDFLMDDMITGSDSIEECRVIRYQVTEALRRAGMKMHKWCANNPTIISDVPVCSHATSDNKTFDENHYVKTLGIAWNPDMDSFQYKISDIHSERTISKRTILSDIASLFDPLGLLSPIIVKAKIIMKKIWQSKLKWDDELPDEIRSEWVQLRSHLIDLHSLRIPRKIIANANPVKLELHGFCDASEEAYGACIYMRCIYSNGSISTRLICSKSRIAPLKLVTIPRLELCGALLLVDLFYKVQQSLILTPSCVMMWTDSTIVLGWINTSAHLKTFVANRVSKILEHTKACDWHHVRSDSNPADPISRGVIPSQLISLDLWWYGPKWLSTPQSDWPSPLNEILPQDLPEVKTTLSVTTCSNTKDSKILSRYSKLHELLRVTALCMRFMKNCKNKDNKVVGPLSPLEIHNALHRWIKIVQNEAFADEIKALTSGKEINSKSKLKQLNPFIDDTGMLRVGGRLSKAITLSYDQIHPLLIPSNHLFVTLLVRTEHIRLLHAGPQALLASLRRKYWPIRGKDLTKKIYHQCMTCFKVKPREINQLMGDLPQHRVEPARPFLRTGVDFCGPFYTSTGKRRNRKLNKCYVSLFVCFTTKSIHLELVSDLSTESFLAALRRFIGRRGKPLTLYSDNATNFIGARTQLRELYLLFRNEHHKNKLCSFLTKDGLIEWKTIPPRSPHHGGLWESSVKLAKFHLKRVVGNANLGSDEFNTVLIQVEACLNSRPLTPLSTNPNDLSPITPGHFLIGEPLTSVPEPDLQQLKLNTLDRWQLVQRITQHFWSRWSREYLATLQSRAKWRSSSPNVKVGSLVIIKEDNLPPLRWRLGRILELHHGDDGLVRVVTCRTSSGDLKRSIAKICPLPDNCNSEAE